MTSRQYTLANHGVPKVSSILHSFDVVVVRSEIWSEASDTIRLFRSQIDVSFRSFWKTEFNEGSREIVMTAHSFSLIRVKHNIEPIQHSKAEHGYIIKNHKFDRISVQQSSDHSIYKHTKSVFVNKLFIETLSTENSIRFQFFSISSPRFQIYIGSIFEPFKSSSIPIFDLSSSSVPS